MKKYLLLMFLGFSSLWGQDMLDSKTTEDTKSVEKYYSNIFEQKSSESSNEMRLLPNFQVDKKKILEEMQKSIPLAGPINPKEYYVGPGDLLEIDVWGDIPFKHFLNVTPEGKLIVPDHGIINVGNVLLSEAKVIIERELRKTYLKGEITTTLLQPRVFTVNVSGIVGNPGNYYATSTQRVDEVIYQANLINEKKIDLDPLGNKDQKDLINQDQTIRYYGKEVDVTQKKVQSLRNIKVYRNNKDTLSVDLIRYYATGNNKYNPILKDGDRVVVPNIDLESNSVSISGAVRLEGEYEFFEKDSLKSMIEIAQGMTKLADLEKIDLYRLNPNSFEIEHMLINYQKILNGSENDIALRPNDRVVVREKVRKILSENVIIKGEVNRPGLYPIVRGQTKLSEIIKMAGGFTEKASLVESKVFRNSKHIDEVEKNPDYERLSSMRLSDLGYEQRKYYNYEAAVKRNYVSANFTKIFNEMDDEYDITLSDGDVIIVPEKHNTIYIYGQVANPGYMDIVEGMDYEYYINMAGGFGEMAKEGDIMVIKGGSKKWVDPVDVILEPGDAIFVPRERDTNFEYYFEWFSKIVGVVGAVATTILLIK